MFENTSLTNLHVGDLCLNWANNVFLVLAVSNNAVTLFWCERQEIRCWYLAVYNEHLCIRALHVED